MPLLFIIRRKIAFGLLDLVTCTRQEVTLQVSEDLDLLNVHMCMEI